MSKASDCIYCGDPAGSAEHVILAAIGGFRTDRGILCGPCNNAFGADIDAALVRDLAPLNAVIGVMNGRSREPIAATAEQDATEMSFVLTNSRRLDHPDAVAISDTTQDGIRSVYAIGSSQKQLDDFVHRMKGEGKPVKVVRRERPPRLFTTTPTVYWEFGGSKPLRAIARLVLNLVASFRPSVARDPGVAAVKDFIKTGGAPEPWVNYAYAPSSDEQSKFEFSHRFVLMFDAERQQVRAHVSLADVIELAVTLGSAQLAKTETIVYEMNLLARSASGSDIDISEVAGLTYPTPIPLTPDPIEMIHERVAQLVFKRNAHLWAQDAPSLVGKLNEVREYEPDRRREALTAALTSQRQRLLNIAVFVARDLPRRASETVDAETGEALRTALGALVEASASSPTGVTQAAAAYADRLVPLMADHLLEILQERPIEPDELRYLLEGKRGAAVIARDMLEYVERASSGGSSV